MTNEKTTPAWLIERLALGELDAAAAAEVRARLVAEGRDPQAVLDALAEDNRAQLQALPKERAAATIRARLAQASTPARRRPTWVLVPALGMSLVAALVAGRLRPTSAPPDGPELEETGIKGTEQAPTRLLIYRQHDGRAQRLGDGAHAGRGDLLQLVYASRDHGYGVILSVDGRGHVTLHMPDERADTAATLQTRRQVQLPASYELDDAPGFERFFLVTAPAPFAVAPVLQAAHALAAAGAATPAPLPLPPGFTQTSLRLDKGRKDQP